MERQRKKTMKYFHMLQGVFQLMSKLPIYRGKNRLVDVMDDVFGRYKILNISM